jgi:GTPase
MFVDRVRIRVTGGRGGNGCSSFRREKYVPRGGPNGGDGGNGGDVIIVADSRLASLLDLRYHPRWVGERGGHGQGKNRHGKKGLDTFIHVPPGTLVRDYATGEAISDLTEDGATFLAAAGGQGGKGNARFATSTNRAPRFCELGEPGEEAEYLIELKLIAEVGLVGLPNAGKSTFLASATSATPKVAGYPFTTLSPNLGVAFLSDHRSLTIADIPGIIEGAAEGKGLGHDFLRHIERTKVLLYIIDLGDDDPVRTREILDKELAQHSAAFSGRPKIVALNKADIAPHRARFEELKARFKEVFMISAATGEGVPALLEHLWQLADELRRQDKDTVESMPEKEYAYEPAFVIAETSEGFRVEGKRVLQAVQMTDFSNEFAVRRLQERLQHMGVFKALKRRGAEPGKAIQIGDIELEYHED